MEQLELFGRLRESAVLKDAIERIDAHWSPRVQQYLEAATQTPHQSKAIKDAIWGMIELGPGEVLVVDSPPLQRLRRVRQLGLGFLTYPTAGYSRFEHTLGAIHQSERMLRAVARRSDEQLQQRILDSLPLVRLAALMHDVGHLPLSHVSERFYKSEECPSEELNREAEDLRGEVASILHVPKVHLAECLSVLVLATPSMESILTAAGYAKGDVAAAGLAIAGRAWAPEEVFVAQMISNVIDADKLDYMFRDGFVTRVPLAVDLERLLYKLKVVKTSSHALPAERKGHIPHNAEVLLLGTDVAGNRLSLEVLQARSMLFQRVYLHHKTRAAERIALQALGNLEMPVVDLLAYDDELFSGLGAQLFEDELQKPIARLTDRRLPRRAFAISAAFAEAEDLQLLWRESQDDDVVDEDLAQPPEQDDQQGPNTHAYLAKRSIDWILRDPPKRAELESEIREKTRELAAILDIEADPEIWLDTPAEPIEPPDAALVLVRADGDVGRDHGYASTAATETFEPLHIAHVFADAPAELSPIVYIACEIVLQDKLQLTFDRDAADHSKVRWSEVTDRKRRLERQEPSIFGSHGRLRPPSDTARRTDAAEQIEALAERFHHYSTDVKVRVDADRITDFLDQFPEDLVRPAIAMLERVTFLDRQSFADFPAHLTANTPPDAILAPLTSMLGKSADHLPYFFQDRPEERPLMRLEEALAEERPVVIYDDLLLSGTQSEKVVLTWFGERNHKASKQLDESQRTALRDRLHSLQFGWAWDRGIGHLRPVLEKRGLSGEIGGMSIDGDGSPLDGLPKEEELRSFLREVGASLLLTTRGRQPNNPWNEEGCQEHALGYGNCERLVVTEYNCPTGTITALWKNGGYRNARWLPLFPRRRS